MPSSASCQIYLRLSFSPAFPRPSTTHPPRNVFPSQIVVHSNCLQLFFSTSVVYNCCSQLLYKTFVRNFCSQLLFSPFFHNLCSQLLFPTFIPNGYSLLTVVHKCCSQLLLQILAHNIYLNFYTQL